MGEFPAILTFDSGLSDSKIIWRVNPFKPELQMMGPEVREIEREEFEFYKSKPRMTVPLPENEAIVECAGKLYAVGFIAHKHFQARVVMTEPKYEWAIAKVLAAVGVMAVKEGLADEFDLALALPLPFVEWQSRHRFEKDIKKALTSFSFCDRPMSVNLKVFICVPEGGGHVLSRAQKIGSAFNQQKIVSLMWGYRDISVVVFDKGEPSGVTVPLGFHEKIKMIKDRILWQESRERERILLEIVHQSGKNILAVNFEQLLLSADEGRKAEEAAHIAEVVKQVRAQYWKIAYRAFSPHLPIDANEMIVGGGAYSCYKSELKASLRKNFSRAVISWSAGLEEDVQATFNLPNDDKGLYARLTDPHGLSIFARSQVCPNGTFAAT